MSFFSSRLLSSTTACTAACTAARTAVALALATAAGWASAHPGHGEHSPADWLEHLGAVLMLGATAATLVGLAARQLARVVVRQRAQRRSARPA